MYSRGMRLGALLYVVAIACSPPDEALLLVTVKTDLVPGREFTAVHTELDRGGAVRTLDLPATPMDDFIEGHRVAEIGGLEPGPAAVRVELRDADGRVVLARNASLEVDGTTGLTLVFSRTCQGVVCPAPDGDPDATECVGARCVTPECTDASCLPSPCSSDGECADRASCTRALCVEGVCLEETRDEVCDDGEHCDPAGGCIADDAVPSFGTFAGGGIDSPGGVDVGPFGNVYVTGAFQGTIDLGSGPLTSAGGYDVFVASFTADGRPRWSRSFGGPDFEVGDGVAVDGDGNVALIGTFDARIDFGGGALVAEGEDDFFVASLTTDGEHRWSRRYGGAAPTTPFGNDAATAIAGSLDGLVAVGGKFRGTADFGGGPITSGSSDGFDGFVLVLGPDGSYRWARRFGTTRYNRVQALAFDAAGNLYASGYYEGTPDFGGGPAPSYFGIQDAVVIAFDATGAYRWSTVFGGSGFDWPLALDTNGSVVFAGGYFEGSAMLGDARLTSAGGRDGFMSGLDGSDGSVRWAWSFGGSACDSLNHAHVGASGRIFVTGELGGPMLDVGGHTVTSAGSSDVLIAEIGNDGTVLSAQSLGGPGGDGGRAVVATPSSLYLLGHVDGRECDDGPGDPSMQDTFLRRLPLP